jgi:hypothetical protein
VRIAARANGSGLVTGLPLLDTPLVAVAEPAPGGAGLPTRFDIPGAFPATLALDAAPGSWRASVTREGGAPIAGASVTARPRGAVASLSGAARSAISGEDGALELELVGGGTYDIRVEPAAGAARLEILGVVAPAAGAAIDDDVAVPGSTRVTGDLAGAGGAAAARVHLAFFCLDCPSPEIPIAETVTDAAGRFAVELPDAGVVTSFDL